MGRGIVVWAVAHRGNGSSSTALPEAQVPRYAAQACGIKNVPFNEPGAQSVLCVGAMQVTPVAAPTVCRFCIRQHTPNQYVCGTNAGIAGMCRVSHRRRVCA